MLTELLAVTVIIVLAVISPGPDFAIVSRNSLKYSRTIGYATSLGIALGLIVHVAYSLIGIGFIISQSVVLFSAIKYLGAAYLVYIGIQALRAKQQSLSAETPGESAISYTAAVRMGFLTNVLNPKATLFFLALFTQVLGPETGLWIKFFFAGEIMLIAFVWFSVLSYLLTVSGIQSSVARIGHHIERVMGAVLVGLGIKVAFFTPR